MIGRGGLAGQFALPAHPQTLATLRSIFRSLAIRYGLDDLDTAALRDSRLRALTQAVSRWIYGLTRGAHAAVAGIEFDSRHGDHLTMWAVHERGGDPATHVVEHSPIDHMNNDLIEAMQLLDLKWSNS